ncbi:fimbria/pilus outer membrane usher protein [Lysobacter sp. LF1]|uniref:Fimbria/pilus outer membrane usher protein n=1 Tax=Lysobacter stagni TaxID=3045172 RepID=A0ABT6XIA1_9GAMM|nr:fimbria/pilus outer membrane usher protein [Lysobacter sp. LF1]MDI9239887.1 fimbria/pilus outer membrane usher protein [Lysobacter sp. LF1]
MRGPIARPLTIALLVSLAGAVPLRALAAPAAAMGGGMPADFDSGFLVGGAQSLDVERYRYGNPVSPGEFRVDIVLNGVHVTRETVTFVDRDQTGYAQPCLSTDLLQKLGIAMPTTVSADASCVDISEIDADARATFDTSKQTLTLSVPQAALLHQPRGYVDPSQLDAGMSALRLSYNVNFFDSTHSEAYSFLGLNVGANLGDWRFRQSLTGSHTAGDTKWRTLSAHAQRDIPKWKSQLTIGDSFTSGELFDSIGYRGIRVATDDRMLPQSMRGYAPVVRGTANSAARVQIHQNDNLIYETSVAAGQFVIDDLYPTGYGGDLVVTVTEADGSVKTFSVPYASVAQLLRPGYGRFSATVGQLRSSGLSDSVNVGEVTWQRGVNNWLTTYVGGQASDSSYQAVMGGLAVNTPVGAVAFDTTYSRAKVESQKSGDAKLDGTSSRVSYNVVSDTGTNFSLAAYRYSTNGYRSLAETAHLNDRHRDDDDADASQIRSKSRLQVSVNQDLGDWGALHFSGSAQNYWNRDGSDRQYTAGYSKRIGHASIGVSASRVRVDDGLWDNQYGLNITAPLGGSSRQNRAPLLSLSADKSDGGSTSLRTGISGVMGDDGQVSYSASATRRSSSSYDYGLGGAYSTGLGTFGGNVSRSSNGTNSVSANASGALVAFRGGVALAPQLGDTIAVVEARGAKGAKLESGTNIAVDRNGLAVAPYLVPYQYNPISLNPAGGSLDFELKNTSQRVAPTAGAVVKVQFEVDSGRAVIISGLQSNGRPLPFGANAYEGETQVGVVGQGSRLLGRVSADTGTLRVQWGTTSDQQCLLDYRVPPATRHASTPIVETTCRLLDNEG